MAVERIDRQTVAVEAVEALGLDASAVGLTLPEGLAASLRRAASFLCPTTPRALVRTVEEVLTGLPGFTEDTHAELEALVDSLVSYGDLLELPLLSDQGARRQIFLGPPSFVRRATEMCLLMGIRPEGGHLLGDELLADIEYERHVRRIKSSDVRMRDILELDGLVQLSLDQWLKVPRPSRPEELADLYKARISAAAKFAEVEGLRVIDPALPVSYYKGRWRPLQGNDRGSFVARRPQAFGADLWCIVDVGENMLRLVDLPVESPHVRGSDEAWRLQAAFDALAGHPQSVRVHVATHQNDVVLDFFSPVPSWIQRRLDIVGTPLVTSRGALFSYVLPQSESDEELESLRTMMWMSVEE